MFGYTCPLPSLRNGPSFKLLHAYTLPLPPYNRTTLAYNLPPFQRDVPVYKLLHAYNLPSSPRNGPGYKLLQTYNLLPSQNKGRPWLLTITGL